MLCIDLILLMIFVISNGPKVNAPAFNFRIAEGKNCANSTHLKKTNSYGFQFMGYASHAAMLEY